MVSRTVKHVKKLLLRRPRGTSSLGNDHQVGSYTGNDNKVISNICAFVHLLAIILSKPPVNIDGTDTNKQANLAIISRIAIKLASTDNKEAKEGQYKVYQLVSKPLK